MTRHYKIQANIRHKWNEMDTHTVLGWLVQALHWRSLSNNMIHTGDLTHTKYSIGWQPDTNPAKQNVCYPSKASRAFSVIPCSSRKNSSL